MTARKGQYAIIEQTILFGVGISIAFGFLFAFNALGSDVSESTTEIDTQLVSKLVAVNTIELVESGSDGHIVMELPAEIGSNEYAVQMDDNGVGVVSTGVNHVASLYGLQERLVTEGHMISNDETLAITVEDGSVVLEGGQ